MANENNNFYVSNNFESRLYLGDKDNIFHGFQFKAK